MNIVSRIITGIIAMVIGVVLILWNFYEFWTFIYGVIIFVIGVFILFNNKEDDIEKIKSRRHKK
tara:strand:- start:1327 stop:1518 length:192 start_codon:yes stop_codon:yes gene_type:complete